MTYQEGGHIHGFWDRITISQFCVQIKFGIIRLFLKPVQVQFKKKTL